MSLDAVTLNGATPLLISVQGQWSTGPSRDWLGWAQATEPFVALAFLRTPEICRWARSERAVDSAEVRLALFPYDEEGKDVQVNFSVGSGCVIRRAKAPAASYQPDISERHSFQSGVIQRFTQIAVDPWHELFILFLARQDVRSARNGLWHLRKELAESIVCQPIRRMMTYGRRGYFDTGSI